MTISSSEIHTEENKLKHGSLFSGIGGFDLAASVMGWENVFHCEVNQFCRKLLKYYWNNAISYEDIKQTNFTIHRGSVDIITGGFPCQPYSAAGKRLGKEDDRHLWPEMLRAIREISPRYVVGENVRGITNWNGGLVFDEVQSDLEDQGYQVTSFLLPSCAVNAPHRRDRIWFIAHSDKCNDQGTPRQDAQAGEKERIQERDKIRKSGQSAKVGGGVTDTFIQGLQRDKRSKSHGKWQWQEALRSVAEQVKIQSWDRWPTQSPICSRNDGIPTGLDGITFSSWRNESIKAYGNAVVPRVVLQIFKAIEQHNGILKNNPLIN